MVSQNKEMEIKIRKGFKYFNYFMIFLWRLGLGQWVNIAPRWGGRIMVIVHTGRKSGKKRYVPVNYATVGGEIFCTAGFGKTSRWYLNLIANPNIEVWLPDGWYAGVVEEITNPDERLPLIREVLIASGFVAPMIGIDPKTIGDEKLAELCQDYRLLRVRRTAACTGRGGPGELAWVWPLTTLYLLLRLMSGKRRK